MLPLTLKNMKILKILFFITMIAFGLFSVGCFLYPTISNQINEHYNESTINEYKYNVIFLESQKQAIEAALRGNAPTAHNRKIKL